MGRLGGEAVVADVRAAAENSDPLIRLGAAQAAGNLPPELRLEAIGRLLADETRAVRVAAVTALGNAPTGDLLGDQRRDFDAAVENLRAFVQANADMAEAQNSYGLFLMGQRQASKAETALRRAIALDSSLAGAHANLAELYRATGQNEKSESTYAEAIRISPEDPMLRYGHALSLIRAKNMTGAAQRAGSIRAARSSQRPIPDHDWPSPWTQSVARKKHSRLWAKLSPTDLPTQPARRCHPIWAQAASVP